MNFEKALRNKYRFVSKVGVITTEDLFDLPLTSERRASLNDVAKTLAKEIREQGEEDFVSTSTNSVKKQLEDKLEIVKYIIQLRQEESAKAVEAKQNEAQREKIMQVIQAKKDQALLDMPLEELEKLVNK